MGKKHPKQIRELTKKITKSVVIPAQPQVMLEAARLSERHDPDWRQINRLIRGDMALAAAVLTAVNGARSKKQGHVASIEKAVLLLGWQKIQTLLDDMFHSHPLAGHQSLAQQVRKQGIMAAETTLWLAHRMAHLSPHFKNGCYPLPPLDQTYTTALFLHCGMIAMDATFDHYGVFIQNTKQTSYDNLVEEENKTFGTNHALCGYQMLGTMNIPKPIRTIVLDHHTADRFNKPGQKVGNLRLTILQGIVLMSEYLRGELSHKEWLRMEDRILDFFAITPGELETLAETLIVFPREQGS